MSSVTASGRPALAPPGSRPAPAAWASPTSEPRSPPARTAPGGSSSSRVGRAGLLAAPDDLAQRVVRVQLVRTGRRRGSRSAPPAARRGRPAGRGCRGPRDGGRRGTGSADRCAPGRALPGSRATEAKSRRRPSAPAQGRRHRQVRAAGRAARARGGPDPPAPPRAPAARTCSAASASSASALRRISTNG